MTYWWSYFDDPVLNELIARACRQNLDLWEAYYRIVEARAQVGVVRGELDLRLESAAASEYAANTKNDAGFWLPPVVWSLSARRVM